MKTGAVTEIENSYSVKNIKTFIGNEGSGFECSIYKNGKKIGTAMDPASGGPVNFFLSVEEETSLESYCGTLPRIPWEINSEGCVVDKDIFVTEMVEYFLQDKKLRRWCKKKTVFILKDSTDYWLVKSIFSPKIKEYLVEKYGNNLKEIINERLI